MHASTKSAPRTVALAIVTLTSIVTTASAQAPGDVAFFQLERYRLTAADGTPLNYFGKVGHNQGQFPSGPISATRPNGQQNWSMATQTQLNLSSGMSSMSLAEVNAWSEQNFKGTWQFGVNGSLDKSYDTTAQWDYAQQFLSNDFLELASPSIALFDTIRTQGLTGTFTFNLTRSVAQWNMGNWFQDFTGMVTSGMAAPIQILAINGSSFDVTITNALAANSQLQLTNAIRYENPGISQSRYVSMSSRSYYGMPNPVPAPSAIALLGLASFAERRRRRA